VATIVYLDAEDEITSAAARIRQSADPRVALVIPFGSRVATSRINFKLLSREAATKGRRLDIVAPDASARALAASAGLPVFASVAEYEDALDAPPPDAADDDGSGNVGAAAAGAAAAAGITAAAAKGARSTGAPSSPGGPGDAGDPGTVTRPGRPDGTGTASPPQPREAAGREETGREAAAAREEELDAIIHRGREVPVAPPRRRRPGARVVVALLVLLAGVAAAAVAAVVFLPAADITITPHVERVGPIGLRVTADPGATAVDEAARIIPAQSVPVPVTVDNEFPATGKRVETTPATGGVRWRNCDPSASYTIPKGTTVRTAGGIEFAIDESVFLPVAVISGGGNNVSLRCQASEVAVTAVKPGPDGNVDAGEIKIVPARYNRTLITVTNSSPTSGGSREEFTRISQKDVDAALATLQTDLEAQFEIDLEGPLDLPAGVTAFPETGQLGEASPTVDPATLVNQEVDTFTLGLAATGTVLAVDSSPIEVIAADALDEAVTPGYQLVDGSTRIAVGEGSVEGDQVVFRVAGVAKQLRPLDAVALKAQVMGLSESDARAALAPYGDVQVELWPGMVTSIPTIDQRVTLVVLDPVDTEPDTPPVPATAQPTVAPEPAGDGAVPSEPVPSG